MDVDALVGRYVESYARYKATTRRPGQFDIRRSGVNHPVFKDKPVNTIREVFIGELMAKRGG